MLALHEALHVHRVARDPLSRVLEPAGQRRRTSAVSAPEEASLLRAARVAKVCTTQPRRDDAGRAMPSAGEAARSI
jgi:hypothetical protein